MSIIGWLFVALLCGWAFKELLQLFEDRQFPWLIAFMVFICVVAYNS